MSYIRCLLLVVLDSVLTSNSAHEQQFRCVIHMVDGAVFGTRTMAVSLQDITEHMVQLLETNQELEARLAVIEAARQGGAQGNNEHQQNIIDAKKLFPEPWVK